MKSQKNARFNIHANAITPELCVYMCVCVCVYMCSSKFSS